MPSEGTAAAGQKISFTISELAERFIAQLAAFGRSPLTLAMYRRSVADLCDSCRCDDIRMITRELIDGHVDEILSRPTIGRKEKRYWIARLKIFLGWIAEEGLLLSDPTSHIKLPAAKKRTHPPYLTQAEVAYLLDCIPTGTPEHLRDRTLLELLYSAGLRTGELCRLTANDVSFADGTVTILMSKGKKDRLAPVGETALHYLDRYILEVRGLKLAGSLFCHMNTGEPLKGWQIQRQIVSKWKQHAGIRKKVFVRTFRHSFAIHMLENGASIRHIQAMLGHADLRTTQKYTNVVPTELKRAHAAAHPAERRRGRLPAAHPKIYHARRMKTAAV